MSHDSGAVQVLPSRSGANPSVRVADQHFRSAEESLRRGEYDRAAAEFTYCIQLTPNRAEAFSKRGDVWRVLGRLDSAIADYSAALQIHPRNVAALLNRGQLHALAGRHRPAVADFTEALDMDPANAAALLARGQSLNRLGEIVQALADFTRAIELAPGNAMAFVERGSALLAHGDASAAVTDLRRAIQLNPFLWLALAKRAEAHLALGLPEQAASDLSEALRLDPQNPEMLASRGAVQLRLGKCEAALNDCDEAVALAPEDPALRAQRAKVRRALGKLEEAEQDLTDAIRIKPDASLHLDRAELRLEAKKYDPAFADFIEAGKRSPRSGQAFLGQALVYLARDDHAMAAACLDRSIEVSPDCAEAYHQRARCKARMEQIEAAHEDATRAIELDSENVPARRLRADLSLRLGRTDDAFADIAQLVNLAPEDAVVYHLRGKVEFRRGRLDAAIQDLSVALKLNPNFTEALADRAGVYRGLGKHREALFDLTSAVQQDPKYSAEYLVQRGIVHGATGELNRATADFLVALQLDPNNKAAVRGKELVSQLKESRGPSLSESQEFELDRNAEAERVLGGGKRGRSWRSLIEPDEFAESKPRRVRRTLPAPEPEPDLDLALTDDAAFEVEGGFDAESESGVDLDALDQPPPRKAAAPRPPRRAAPPPTPEDAIDELLKEDPGPAPPPPPAPTPAPAPVRPAPSFSTPSAASMPVMNPAKPATPAIPKKKKKEDPEDRALRMRKYRRYAIIALGSCFMLYWGVSFAWDLVPQSENPFSEYSAQEFVERYAKDSAAADEKFAEKRIVVRGKVKVIKPKGRGQVAPKILFNVEGHTDCPVECQFAGEDVELNDGQEYRITGKPSRFKPGTGVVLKECNLMPGGSSASRNNVNELNKNAFASLNRTGNADFTRSVRGVHTDHTLAE
ncbi:MAG: tetratricopeptide repeat protein [Gemmataceae bacterium]